MSNLNNDENISFEEFFTINLDLLCIADTNGMFIKINKSWEDILGYPINELEGKKFLDFVHSDDMDSTLNALYDLAEQKQVLNFTNRYRCKDGSYRYIEWRSIPYGNIIYAAARDITERIEKQMKLTEQEENFRMLFETIDDMIFVANEQASILHTNKAVINKLGYSEEELLKMNILDVHPEIYRNEALGIFDDMFKGARDYCPLPLKTKYGNFIPVETRVWFGKWNGIDCIYGISKDLSKQHAALEKAQKLFDNNPALMVVSKVSDRKFTDVNNAFTKILGYTKEDIIGKTSADLKLFVESEKQNEVATKLENSGRIHDVELQVRKKDGSIIDGRFSGELIDNQGEKSFLTVMIDITEQKRQERELKIAKEEAETANIMKSQFLANTSHEIRTPMNGIMGFLDLLQSTNLSSEQKEYVREAKSASEILLYLINDILDFSKIEAGKMTIEKTNFKIRTAVEDAVSVHVPKASEKNIELHTMVKSNVPEEVIGDPARLRQILNNLVGNAVKFTLTGEINVTVECVKKIAGKALLKFEVNDTGIGISEENIKNLFKPFTQADASTTRKFGGTGLGLAISKELIRLMDGDISVDSEIGKGSTFTFSILLEISEKATEINVFEKLDGVNVLIVDDNENNRKIIRSYIEDAGCKAFEADGADKAITTVLMNSNNENKIKLAIVDFQMPGMDGYQLATTLRTIPFAKDIELILLTSAAKKGDANEAKKHGFSGYLSKPIRRNELLDCISLALGLKVNNEENAQIITRHKVNEHKQNLQPKILLVEDNEMNRKIVIAMLKQHNILCDVAFNGEEAIQAVSQKDYDIVFMDCQMPVMDGYESTAKIRSLEKDIKHTTIIAMTANAMEGDRDKCIKAGMDDYISKPLDFKLVLNIIRKYTKKENSIPTNLIDDNIEEFMQGTGLSEDDAREIFIDYLKYLPNLLKDIADSILNNDFSNTQSLAHQLKGSTGNLRLNSIYELAIELEKCALKQEKDNCENLLSKIQDLIN